jgi:hypothetical protein
MRSSVTTFTSLSGFFISALICGFAALFLLMLFADEASAQRKPSLRLMRRDYFAGRFVLIPADGKAASYQLSRLIAQVADHDLILPPRAYLIRNTPAGGAGDLIAWMKSIDYADADGAIVSLGLPTDGMDAVTLQSRFEAIRGLHREHPRLAIYGFIAPSPQSSDPISSAALELLNSGVLDYLLISDNGLTAPARERILNEITHRQFSDRVLLSPAGTDAESLLVARQLNHRFGLTPRIAPFFSAQQSPVADSLIAASGGLKPGASAAATRSADLLLFVHQPGTDEQKFAAFISELARAVDAGYRVALADVATERTERERLLNAIRSRRLLDRLFAYAASDNSSDGLAVALAQASARLITARFLRDDVDRLRRTEQAQIELLLNRWLKAAVCDPVLLPQLDAFVREQLKADPEHLAAATERAEEFISGELRRVASEHFSEQFRNNIHSILLSSGERAEFRVRALQSLRLSFPLRRTSDPEIRARVYLFLENLIQTEQPQAEWGLKDKDKLDDRLLSRYNTVNWSAFAVGAGVAQLGIVIAGNEAGESESYTIRSRLQRKIRQIEIITTSARGAFYALTKLEQLGVDGRLAQDFQLTESPAFRLRGLLEAFDGWSQRDRLDVLRFIGRMRMNRYYYAPQDDPFCYERWHENYTGNDLTRFSDLLRAASESFVELVYAFSPGAAITYSGEADFAALTRRIDALAGLGVRRFALFVNEAPLSQPEDRARFQTPAAAQAFLLSRTLEYLKRAFPNATLTARADGSREYLKELSDATPKEISFLLTNAGLQAGALQSHRLIFQDDFPVNGSGQWRLFPEPDTSLAFSESLTGFAAQPARQAHVAMLPLSVMAEYMWNPRDFNPEVSLTRALNLLYDARSRAAMRVWSNAFREGSVFGALFKPSSGEINAPLIEQRLNDLHNALEGIGITRERGLLRGELAALLTRSEKLLAQLKNDPVYEKLPDGRYRKR